MPKMMSISVDEEYMYGNILKAYFSIYIYFFMRHFYARNEKRRIRRMRRMKWRALEEIANEIKRIYSEFTVAFFTVNVDFIRFKFVVLAKY